MRFEPVSHDPRGQQPGVVSTVPPLAPPNGRHHVPGPLPAALPMGEPFAQFPAQLADHGEVDPGARR
ncbi:hypothetical protein, partial [Micromonospora sp. R42106]|uniref:hypothetical protein n=1 Tax=Micromonospora sp. R42106 TaxID=2929778 RepID=UPI001FF7EB8F